MNKLAFLFLFIVSICLNQVDAAIYSVGTEKAYSSPNALYQAGVVQTGDTIEIEGEVYSGNASLAVWSADEILIRGVNGRPHLIADGKYILGKGIWVLAGNNIIVENIEFSEAIVPDNNGAGIRLDGIGLTVRHCYFHDNENGILTSNPYAGDILIEHTEFDNNGYGDGFSHNLYIGHVNSLTFRYNYSHHAKVGHNLKSRANENFIYYNRIMDEASGYSSRLIDLSNGGFTIIMGNLLMQGPNAENNTLIGYGKEGLSNSSSHIYVVNNSMVNKRVASCNFLDIQSGTEIAEVYNNIFAGTGTSIKGNPTATGGNIADPDIANMDFVDEQNYNYAINNMSAAIDSGVLVNAVNGYSLTPDKTYEHPVDFADRMIDNERIDVGAYEYASPTAVHQIQAKEINLFPNPVEDKIHIDLPEDLIQSCHLFSLSGQLLRSNQGSNQMHIKSIVAGIYLLQVKLKDGRELLKPIVKL